MRGVFLEPQFTPKVDRPPLLSFSIIALNENATFPPSSNANVSPLRLHADYTHTETPSAASPTQAGLGICIPKAGHYPSVRNGDGNQNCGGHEGDNNVVSLSALMADMIKVQDAFEQC